jgi:hypothetical protein
MKHLILITRKNRAERPSEAIILSDSKKVLVGQQLFQDPSKDNFFMVTGDISKHAIRLSLINAENPYGRTLGDGVAFYRYSHKDTGATELRTWESTDIDDNPITVSAKAQLNGVDYETLDEARTTIDALGASEGYTLIDEGKDSQVIESRPSLVGDEIDGVTYDIDLSVKTAHSTRLSDNDRY